MPTRIVCDKEEIVKMLHRMYISKVCDLLNIVPLMAYFLLGLETLVFGGTVQRSPASEVGEER